MKPKVWISICLFTCAVNTATATDLTPDVDKLINGVDPNINMGAMVVDLNTGKTLYKKNADKPFIPASNMKLFSDAAALMVLGPDYRFQTQLSSDAEEMEHGTLKGNLYIHMHGDPSFSQAQLTDLIAQLDTWGIQRIDGDVIFDSDTANIAPHPKGWSKKDVKSSYGAPISPLILDENRLAVTVNPSYKVGAPAIVEFDRPYHGLNVTNNIKTTRHKRGCWVNFKMDENNNVTLGGCINTNQAAIQHEVAIQNPFLYAKAIVQHALAEQHIALAGTVKLGKAPEKNMMLATHASSPMRILLANTLKSSDNLYADSLYLHAASKLKQKPLDWPEAQDAVKGFLQKKAHLNMKGAVLADGSGLSRNDKLTPEQTIQLLQFLHQHFPLAYEYVGSLPIGGIDGTLKKRFRKPAQQGYIRAKTGTMTGVISLSGYLYTANGHTLAFAIYVNKRPKTDPRVSGRYRYLVDKMCTFFIKQAPDDRRVHAITPRVHQTTFQGHRKETKKIAARYSSWRRLEYSLRNSMRHQSVDIVFRGRKLVLIDHNKDPDKVWTALQKVRQKYPFAVALDSIRLPRSKATEQQLLWIKKDMGNKQTRTWTICAVTQR